MIRMATPSFLDEYATHEAAHAVVAFVLGLHFRGRGISIIPRKVNGVLSGGQLSLKGTSRCEDFVRAVLAGPIYDFDTQRGKLTFEKADRQVVGMIGDAHTSATILADLWASPKNSPLSLAAQLSNWAFFNDYLAETVAFRVHKKQAQAAHFFLTSFRFAVWLSQLPFIEAEAMFAQHEPQPIAGVVRNKHTYDTRVFPFLHGLANDTWRLLRAHRSTIEALASLLVKKRSMRGSELASFLTASTALDGHHITQREYESVTPRIGATLLY